MIENNEKKLVISEVVVICGTDEDGEGVWAKGLILMGKPIMMPFIAADEKRLSYIYPAALEMMGMKAAKDLKCFASQRAKILPKKHTKNLEMSHNYNGILKTGSSTGFLRITPRKIDNQ